ncbi:MAG: hypothetical protein CBB71_12795 [Rhodopirellula sp. TMED11]|nr:MAG: hypothetical protein CBB71_12795 [Rhodopirellula sp. TMED11]
MGPEFCLSLRRLKSQALHFAPHQPIAWRLHHPPAVLQHLIRSSTFSSGIMLRNGIDCVQSTVVGGCTNVRVVICWPPKRGLWLRLDQPSNMDYNGCPA